MLESLQTQLTEQMATQEARLQGQIGEQINSLAATMEARLQVVAGAGSHPAQSAMNHGRPPDEANQSTRVVRTEIAATGPSTPRLHTMKLDVPKFSGEDPHQWIFNIQEYFDFHKVPEDQRLQIAGFSLEREASEWIYPEGYTWKKIPNDYKESYFEEFKKFYKWDASIDRHVRKAFQAQAGIRYTDMVSKFKSNRTSTGKPACIHEDTWRIWEAYWDRPDVKAKSEQQRKNRMSEVAGPGTGCSRHTGGSRSAIEHYHKLRDELQKEHNLFECFEHMHKKKNGAFVDERSKKIAHRFGTHHFEDYQANLAKLTQKGSVADFQTEFEKLMNKVTGIQEPLLISFFVGGLKPNLRREMLIAKPQSLLEAFKLAKAFEVRHEEIVRDSRATNRGWSYKTTFPVRDSRAGNDGHTLPHEAPVTQFPTSKGLLPTPPPSSKGVATSTVPIRRMSAAEVQARREKGLCFYCDQKYSPGHRCRRSLHLLIAADDIGEDGNGLGEPDTALEESHADEEITGDISALNTLAGQGNPRSLRLWGDISRQKCLVLIDSGSTHNFIKPSAVEMLQLPIQPIKPFQVYIGSGDTLLCSHYCPNVTVVLQGTTFQIDLHVLPIAGPEVVLGIIWLQSLGTVAHDYAKLIMKFKYNNNMVTLKGETLPPKIIPFPQFQKIHPL
nr:uncharacterized protein LOC112097934 [Ipomoea trifida]